MEKRFLVNLKAFEFDSILEINPNLIASLVTVIKEDTTIFKSKLSYDPGGNF